MTSRRKLRLSWTSALGIVLFAFSSGFPPFDDYTEIDLSTHMAQHILIIISGVLIAYPFARKRFASRTGGGILPAALLTLSALLVAAWHFPGPWDTAVLNPSVHLVEHLSFLLVGLLIGSWLLLLTDSGKIGGLLAAFFGHMGYALLLVGPWNIQVYDPGIYPLSNQQVLGWALLLTGPQFLVGVAYVVARNPSWLSGISGGPPPMTPRKTLIDRIKAPRYLAPTLTAVLLGVSAGYGVTAALALSTSNPRLGPGTSAVYINETPVSWQFSPQNIIVVVGVNSTVVWVSHSISFDTVTGRGGSFSLGPILPGTSVRYTFVRPGVYEYYCQYHPWMTGSVTVLP